MLSTSTQMPSMPITVLSGFLGAGKTTFLRNVLDSSTTKGQSFGLLVNDMASMNIDGKLLKIQSANQANGLDIDTLELENGCVCCTLAEDMLASVSQLAHVAQERQRPYDHIVIECSGIAEPRKIRDIFQEASVSGYGGIASKVHLDTLITVVDAIVFIEHFGSADADIRSNARLAVREEKTSGDIFLSEEEGRRRLTELLLEQVETADIVLINKCDLLKKKEQINLVEDIIRSINSSARIYTCVQGKMDTIGDISSILGSSHGKGLAIEGILEEHRRQVEHIHSHHHHHDDDDECTDMTCTNPSHDHVHHHVTETETTARVRFGITSFVYTQRKPFHPTRFTAFLRSLGNLSISNITDISHDDATIDTDLQSTILRSKGFVWMATTGAAAYYMSHAGQYFELAVLGRWWADIHIDEWPADRIRDIRNDFKISPPFSDEEYEFGDRRQELVFIGTFNEYKQNKIEMKLTECLLTDDELDQYRQALNSNDPSATLRTLWS